MEQYPLVEILKSVTSNRPYIFHMKPENETTENS